MVTATLVDVASTSALTVAVLAAVAFLARAWAVSKIQEAVKADYQQALEELKESLRWEGLRRERAAAIADFLATWVAENFDPAKRNNVALLEIQRQYWMLALWLDTPALRALNKALAHKEGAHHVEALVEVRRSIVGEDQERLAAEEFISWSPRDDWSERTYPRRAGGVSSQQRDQTQG
jgi:hypothetical protein